MIPDPEKRNLPVAGVGGALLLLLLLAVVLLAAVQWNSPSVYPAGSVIRSEFDASVVREELAPARIAEEVLHLGEHGSRMLGADGHKAAADFLRGELENAGYDVIVRKNRVLAPVVLRSGIFIDEVPVEGVSLHPFQPNYFQPMTTPSGGLRGELVLIDDAALKERASFAGAIGVVDLSAVPKNFGLEWTRYAQLGLAGLVLAAPEGMEVDWSDLARRNTMISTLPVNFLRAYAEGDLLGRIGQNATIHLEQRYQEVENETLVGVLTTGRESREALVLTGSYDAFGILQTMANEPLQAVSPATTLALSKALARSRKTLQRDVVVVFDGSQMMAGIGEAHLTSVIGTARSRSSNPYPALMKTEEQTLKRLQELEQLVADADIFLDAKLLDARLSAMDSKSRRFFQEQVRYALQREVFLRGESLLQSKLPLDRSRALASGGKEYDAFQARLAEVNLFKGASSVGLSRLVQRSHPIVSDGTLAQLLRERFARLREHHEFELERTRADASIRSATQRYQQFFVLNPMLLPAHAEQKQSGVAFLQGERGAGSGASGRQEALLSTLVSECLEREGLRDALRIAPIRHALQAQQSAQIGSLPSTIRYWNRFAHPVFMVVNDDRLNSYQALAMPVGGQEPMSLDGMADSLALLGHVALSIGHGAMPIHPPEHPNLRSFAGQVLASGVGQSVIPSFPVAGALVGITAAEDGKDGFRSLPGFFRYPFLASDVYGRYSLLDTPADFMLGGTDGYTPQAFWFAADGLAAWAKDATGSKIFKSEKLPSLRRDFKDLNLVVFRASPVSFLDLTNPQTLQPFAAAGLISREGLSPFLNSNSFLAGDTASVFASPDRHFYGVLRAGLPDNPLVQTVRGFLLGPDGTGSQTRAGGISGQGYLVADQQLFANIALPMAQSMLRVNETRAELQERKHLLDPGTSALIQRSADLLKEAEFPGLPMWEAVLKARDSAAYSAIVHPILRANINGAVVSILWYLGLLVPFVFFMERLVFGFSDIRKQLAVQAVIFLLVFALLRLMHPAFDMIRSAVMILLGFVILLIAGGVTVIFAGKFRENLAALEALRGKATGASVNTMGIVATAFLLGLNNMHRRKVRTGLTCGTLVLITFAMIAFTSVRHDVVESITPVGPAPYQGFLVQNEGGQYITPSEVFALTSQFGHSFPVEARSFLTGLRDNWSREIRMPTLEMRTDAQTGARSTAIGSVLQFGEREPIQSKIPLLTRPFWFGATAPGAARAVILSDRIAADLGLDPDTVDGTDEIHVLLNGARLRVAGIFDSEALDRLRDLNGQSLLPPDISAIPNVRTDKQGAPMADPDDPRVRAADVVILPQGDLGFTVPNGLLRIGSVAVGMEGVPFREARQIILQYLEQSGSTTYFGIDGVASWGSRGRAASLQGLPDLIMPLIIAALTVLNTMKGSVYERRDEIYVYNAVGVAPRYVFFMFFAEAFVYSVVGSVLGYLLAQSTGFFLTIMGWTGGLNMTFAGLNTIYASLAVIAAVFISTIFPARTAMQIAAPSDDSGWELPEPDGDQFAFKLPFTFSARDRVAVLAFFHRFLLDHGEGGAGRFRAGPPQLDLEGDDSEVEPQIQATTWLKPYDLGVSQELQIALPRDPETGEFIARISIERLSGTRESWVRLNRSLMAQVRRQFLHWRAVTPAQKEEFHREALALFRAAAGNRKEQHV